MPPTLPAQAVPAEAYTAWPLLLLTTLVLAGVLAAALRPWWRERRRAALRALPFPAPWRRILRQRVPQVARLPADLQRQLKGHIQVMLAETPFIGCQGQAITDEVRVTVAAQAALLLLGQARPAYFPALRQVLVYPGAFVVDRVQAQGAGLERAERRVLLGESWQQGQVILSWADVLAGAADPADGQNVVLHEFAHQIDQDKGRADGRPWRATRAERAGWDAAMGPAFAQLRRTPSVLFGDYAATDPAEFFAVATERFYEQPRALAEQAPAVYNALAGLYRVHPLVW
jgi:Mlc titration factor MtfA (ptsG expression regulator)